MLALKGLLPRPFCGGCVEDWKPLLARSPQTHAAELRR